MNNGGDIQEIAVKHSTGDFILQPKSSEDFTIDAGGFVNNDDANGITGSGQVINQKNKKRWRIEGPVAWDMQDVDELALIQRVANSSTSAQFIITHTNGSTWGATGTFVGDIQGNTNTAQIPVIMAGGGILEKIA